MIFLRKKIRLPSPNYSGKRIYFVTMCTRDRRPALRDACLVGGMLEVMRDLSRRHEFAVHAYCFMPDHLHLLCEGLSHDSQLLTFMGRFKQQTAFENRQGRGVPLWQPRFYDHILRKDSAMEDVAWYIWMNPVRKSLCGDPREYPFSGSLTLLGERRPSLSAHWTPPWKLRGEQDAGLKPGATQP
jgi:putative transposase